MDNRYIGFWKSFFFFTFTVEFLCIFWRVMDRLMNCWEFYESFQKHFACDVVLMKYESVHGSLHVDWRRVFMTTECWFKIEAIFADIHRSQRLFWTILFFWKPLNSLLRNQVIDSMKTCANNRKIRSFFHTFWTRTSEILKQIFVCSIVQSISLKTFLRTCRMYPGHIRTKMPIPLHPLSKRGEL